MQSPTRHYCQLGRIGLRGGPSGLVGLVQVSRNDNRPHSPMGGPFPRAGQIVHETMRPLTVAAVSLLAATACARPVLYYPAPESGPVQAGAPVSRPMSDTMVANATVLATAAITPTPESRDADIDYLH